MTPQERQKAEAKARQAREMRVELRGLRDMYASLETERRELVQELDRAWAGQSREGSAWETTGSTAVGLAVSYGLATVVLPVYGMTAGPWEFGQIAVIFTVASLVRGYAMRRLAVWWAGKRRRRTGCLTER